MSFDTKSYSRAFEVISCRSIGAKAALRKMPEMKAEGNSRSPIGPWTKMRMHTPTPAFECAR